MTIPARVRAGDSRQDCRNLHPSVWARLVSLCAREGKGPREILLHGPMGVGKTMLLRRFYWELFDHQDVETPLFFAIPPVPFRPAIWARRFLMETAWQWAAFERRDEQRARAMPPPLPVLVAFCRDARLQPLAETLEQFERFGNAPDEGTFLVEWVFQALEQAAERMERRAILMMDDAEYAAWIEDGFEHHLSRAVPPASESGPLRRVWTSRQGTSESHPCQSPLPPAREHWEIAPLSPAASAEFFDARSRSAGLDYDPHVLSDYLDLWGHIPRWLDNFVRQASDLPRSLTAPDHFIQSYMADVLDGPTARDLQDALRLAAPEALYDPARLARAARTRLQWEDRDETPGGPVEGDDETMLRRLARTGLAVYDQGRWTLSPIPVLEDFLRLFVARRHPGENLARSEIALKRRRLVETPQRINRQRRDQEIRRVSLLMHTFRGQSVPANLFQRHLAKAGGETAPRAAGGPREAAGTQAETLGALAAKREEWVQVPCCIGAFPYDPPFSSRREGPPPMPAVVGWCFESSECHRSEESLWVAHLCDAAVITTEELDEVERANRQAGREFKVGRVVGWLITDGRFSREALERIGALRLHVSDRRACETLGELLMRGIREREGAAVTAEREAEEGAPAAGPGARIVSAVPEPSRERIADLLLTPQADMELVAAGAVEQVAAACGFDKETISQMRMATLEACLNAIERSRNAEKRVHLRIEGTHAECAIIVENEGVVFDPQAVEEPDVEKKMGEPYKRGWGLMLMRKFMDRVVFEPCERGTRLRMEKKNPAASAARGGKTASKA